MEVLTHYQLTDYEEVLNQIEEEYRKHETLVNENNTLNSKLSAISLSTKKEILQENVFKCLVKVYNSVFAVYEQLSDKISPYELESAIRCRNRKFYFVEIYIANSFQKRIIHQNWLINACLKSSKNQISKSINVRNKITNPVCMLIPFDDSVDEANLKIRIAWPEGRKWPYLEVSDVPIDISYHFDTVNSSRINSLNSKIRRICKINNGDLKPRIKNKHCQSQLYCTQCADVYLERILKNSYHNVDPRNQATFSRIDEVLITKISVGDEEVTIKLNCSNNVLSIVGNVKELYLVKKYFINELCSLKTLNSEQLIDLEQWKSSLRVSDDQEIAYKVYEALRRLVI